MESIAKVRNFVGYWYKRYLVSTELYMVEPWERVFTHIVLGISFILFWWINYAVIVNVMRDRNPVLELEIGQNSLKL